MDLGSLNIDNYLNWYKQLSLDLIDVSAKQKRLDDLENKLKKYMAEGLFFSAPGGHEDDIRQYNTYKAQAIELKNEISPFGIYTVSFAEDGNEPIYFIPTLEDWELLYVKRGETIGTKKSNFERKITNSILNEKELLKQELEIVKQELFVHSNYFADIQIQVPLRRSVMFGYNENRITSWLIFCDWVYTFDYAVWLSNKIISNHSKNTSLKNALEKPTVNSIALCYYYLSECGGESLSNPVTLNEAAQKYNISEKTLSLARNKYIVDNRQITSVENNTNKNNERLSRIRIAIKLLETYGNNNALKMAKGDFEKIKTKIRNNIP